MTPVVVVGLDGGLVQWTMAAAGEGLPEVYRDRQDSRADG